MLTKNEKKELLIALCAYAPYGVKGTYAVTQDKPVIIEADCSYNLKFMATHGFKCYLRHMSSMTPTESKKLAKYAYFGAPIGDWNKAMDYLNSIYVDYRGFIEKGFALEAPPNLYKKKKK